MLFILTLVCLPSHSQDKIINYDNFDNHLVDSLIFIEINNYRAINGKGPLVYSFATHSTLSRYISGVLRKQQSAGHPDGSKALDSICIDLYNEALNLKDTLVYYEVYSYNKSKYLGIKGFFRQKHFSTWEVSLKSSKNNANCITYDQLAKYIVGLWISSAGHEFIIRAAHSSSLAAGSLLIGDYYWKGHTYIGLYASFQIITIRHTPTIWSCIDKHNNQLPCGVWQSEIIHKKFEQTAHYCYDEILRNKDCYCNRSKNRNN